MTYRRRVSLYLRTAEGQYLTNHAAKAFPSDLTRLTISRDPIRGGWYAQRWSRTKEDWVPIPGSWAETRHDSAMIAWEVIDKRAEPRECGGKNCYLATPAMQWRRGLLLADGKEFAAARTRWIHRGCEVVRNLVRQLRDAEGRPRRLPHCTPTLGEHNPLCNRNGLFCSRVSTHGGPCEPHGKQR